MIYRRGCKRHGRVDRGDREPCGDGGLNRPRKRRLDPRQRKYGLNKANMTGVISLGSGRVLTDFSYRPNCANKVMTLLPRTK